MQEIGGFTAKPFIIAETSVQTGPDAVAAAQSLVSGVRQQPDVLGLVWFDYDKAGVDWRLEARPPVRAALAPGPPGLPLAGPPVPLAPPRPAPPSCGAVRGPVAPDRLPRHAGSGRGPA